MPSRHSITTKFLLLLLVWLCCLPLSSQAATATPNLQVLVVDGSRNDIPLVNYDVEVREILADGSNAWRTSGKTNASGQIAFAPDGLGAGKKYILRAKSTHTTNIKQTGTIDKTGSITFRVGSPLLNVTLVDALTKKPLPDITVNAYRQENGKTVWTDAAKTNANGLALFELETLAQQGIPVTLAAKVFNDFTANQTYTKVGDYTWAMGDTVVTLQDGVKADLPILANYSVQVRELQADNSTTWVATLVTDAKGQLRLNLPTDKKYRLEAKSTYNGAIKYSQPLVTATSNVFKVGTPILQTTLKDAVSGKGIANVKVTAYKLNADGSLAWRNELPTDANGAVSFDLPELSEGGKVMLHAGPYNNFRSVSAVITQAGNFNFTVGETVITVVDGTKADLPPLANYNVYVHEVLADNTVKGYSSAVTDAKGQLLLTLPKDRKFKLEAKSTFNGIGKVSEILTSGSKMTFKVGTPLLKVTLKDGLTGKTIPNIKITANRIKADGSASWRGETATDANGLVTFDLPELLEGGKVQLSATIYNNQRVSSILYDQPGSVTFTVGETLVSVVDGVKANLPALPNYTVQVREILADGKTNWLTTVVTDAAGELHLTLPEGKQYRLEATNTVNNNNKISAPLVRGSKNTFKIGTPLLRVTLKDGITSKAIPNIKIMANLVKVDGKIVWHSETTTDANGLISLDVPEILNGEKVLLYAKPYSSFQVVSPLITQLGAFNFAVGETIVTVVDGTKADLSPLANYNVQVNEILADNTIKGYSSAVTDAKGQLFLTLPKDRKFRVEARSTFNNSIKTSEILTSGSKMTFKVGTPLLQVTLKDGITGKTIPNIKVMVNRVKADGTASWRGETATDANGLVVFDLPELLEGDKAQLFATVYNTQRAASGLYSQPGNVTFTVGETLVSVVDGVKTPSPPLPNYTVQVRELLADGKTNWFATAVTDTAGELHLTLPEGKQFRLEATNTVNNNNKISAPLVRAGKNTFKIGTPLLQATLKDAQTTKPIANVKVTAYRIKTDGNYAWHSETTTDANGLISLDVPEMLNGEKVQLYAVPYNNFRAASPQYTQLGPVDFKVGNVRVKVLDGSKVPPVPMANQKVAVVEKKADGTESWGNDAVTDATGQLRLTLFELNDNREFILKSPSPFNQVWKNSQSIKTAGDYNFIVGTQLLPVTLKDASTGKALPNVQITAYKVLADGKLQWLTRQATDAAGQTRFDLPDLSAGGTIRLQASAFNDYSVWSSDITSPAPYEFKVGSVQVMVKDGTVPEGAGGALTNIEVHVREVLADGSTVWINRGITDAQGLVKMDLPGVDKGRIYILQAQHPVTKAYKTSLPIKAIGPVTFMVGTPLLTVTLQNALTKALLPNTDITLYEIKAGDTSNWPYLWRTAGKTDANGQVKLDSEYLSQAGLNFLLGTTPYNAAGVLSPAFPAKTYAVTFKVGAVPVTLMDRDNKNALLTNVKIDAFEIAADGKLTWRKQGTTDAKGQVIFDLENLRSGNRHVLRAINPFATNKSFFSRILTSEGPVQFAIGRADLDTLDLTPPTVEVLSPSRTTISNYSFDLTGRAKDNTQLDRVEVKLVSGSLSSTQIATLDKATGSWTVKVSPSAVQVGKALTVTATAFDTTGNSSFATRGYQVISDTSAPVITVTSHKANETVLKTGFLLQGSVTDDTSVNGLTISVATSTGTVLVPTKAMTMTPAGDWAYALANGILTQDTNIVVTLTATDAFNKQGVVTLPLSVAGSHDESRQLLNRITFGVNAELLKQVGQQGTDGLLEQQLNPATIDDTAFNNRIAGIKPQTVVELQTWTLQHMIDSRRQLLEVMTWFWDNHFNTDVRKTGNKVAYELAENEAFRANALGNFRNLLHISAKSPAMVYYLDSVKNVKANSNENYARELLELHTVGVDGGYTQKEVEVLAEVFTGWQVQNDRFFFNAEQHNSSAKTFWGNAIPAGGVDEGERVLDILSRHPSTAKYICSKLITQFVSDQPVNSLQSRCVDTFLAQAAAPDQITQVLRVILTSPEFYNTSSINSKVKTPLEFVTATARALQSKGTYTDLPEFIRRMGMDLYQYPLPTGYSDTGDDWVSSAALQERVRFVNMLSVAKTGSATYVDNTSLFKDRGSVTAESIASDLLNWTIGGYYAELEWQTALGVLNAQGAFDPNASSADAQIRETIGTVLSYPEFNYQ